MVADRESQQMALGDTEDLSYNSADIQDLPKPPYYFKVGGHIILFVALHAAYRTMVSRQEVFFLFHCHQCCNISSSMILLVAVKV